MGSSRATDRLRARIAAALEAEGSPGWWGSVFLSVADGTLFASLLFGYVSLWTVARGWLPGAARCLGRVNC